MDEFLNSMVEWKNQDINEDIPYDIINIKLTNRQA